METIFEMNSGMATGRSPAKMWAWRNASALNRFFMVGSEKSQLTWCILVEALGSAAPAFVLPHNDLILELLARLI